MGDPLIACYARAYLVRKGRELMRSDKGYIGTCVEDILFTFDRQVKTDTFRESVRPRSTLLYLSAPQPKIIMAIMLEDSP